MRHGEAKVLDQNWRSSTLLHFHRSVGVVGTGTLCTHKPEKMGQVCPCIGCRSRGGEARMRPGSISIIAFVGSVSPSLPWHHDYLPHRGGQQCREERG